VSENVTEIALVGSMFPEASSYLDVYARHHLTGPRTIYGHGVHLDERDFAFLHATDTALAHCPTSNNFLGSGSSSSARPSGRPSRARGARDRPRRRHELLDPAHDAGGVRGRATVRPCRSRRRARCTSPRAARRTRSTSTIASAASRRAWKPISSCSISLHAVIEMRIAYAKDIDEALAIRWRSATIAPCARPISRAARVRSRREGVRAGALR
jgi:hypothetical protein